MHRHRARGGAAGVQGTAGTPASQALGAVVHGCVLAQAPTRSSACLATRLHCEDGRDGRFRGRPRTSARQMASAVTAVASGRPYSRARRSPEKKVRECRTGRRCVTVSGLAACLRSLFSAIAVQVPGACAQAPRMHV
jgi:hypothetical protein